MDGQTRCGEGEEETYINVKKKIDISKTFTGSLSNKISILLEAIEEIDQLIELRKVRLQGHPGED